MKNLVGKRAFCPPTPGGLLEYFLPEQPPLRSTKTFRSIFKILAPHSLPITGSLAWQLQTGQSFHQALWKAQDVEVAWAYPENHDPSFFQQYQTELQAQGLELVHFHSPGWLLRVVEYQLHWHDTRLRLVHYMDIAFDLCYQLEHQATTTLTPSVVAGLLRTFRVIGHLAQYYDQDECRYRGMDISFRNRVIKTRENLEYVLRCSNYQGDDVMSNRALETIALRDYDLARSMYFPIR